MTTREQAARDLVAAFREAEAAIAAMKAANDKLYRSEVQQAQANLLTLRRSRERMFGFTVSQELASEAPVLTRVLGLRIARTSSMPLVEWIIHTSRLDLGAAGDASPQGT